MEEKPQKKVQFNDDSESGGVSDFYQFNRKPSKKMVAE
jgi:hypothetical protein